ncbi:hypothetical protein MA16_Dca017920 [Dendrobium catenatum]|uniref:Uncharacterized protein n=1 Tax=Dendrobium catenatum TaxID=906689 RepID=A0A2I0W9U3_9ASPA|nr:hypothetical protein MA16_Dca017920 [Dendrobium catenatum]
MHIEAQEDEEEDDLDFNPLLRGETPSEASSSLSSENEDNDDAICRRTRARHSLANYTLEELETFLQESDDDDDLHNVDEEEEYHKFLAAVLLEGDGKEQAGQGERAFDEDEENDADFEVELEEALESDVEEATGCSTEHSGKQYGEAYVPETRQKKRLKEFAKSKKFLLGQSSKATLRPILPYVSDLQRSHVPSFAWKMPSPNSFSHCSASVSGTELINGFTACQIGQLYCLIHEHVQLLLQVFSVCVLDPSRQQVANDLRKLISEMIERHEMSLSWRKIPYPMFCFQSSNLHSSVQVDSNQSASCSWTPVIDNNTVLSILDLAPLRLAKNYLADVKSGQQQPKKSLAATLVESTMKQSVALVPADIAKLAQRFLHLFNAALFPHKPPTPAVANRVLFTDAEDGCVLIIQFGMYLLELIMCLTSLYMPIIRWLHYAKLIRFLYLNNLCPNFLACFKLSLHHLFGYCYSYFENCRHIIYMIGCFALFYLDFFYI